MEEQEAMKGLPAFFMGGIGYLYSFFYILWLSLIFAQYMVVFSGEIIVL
jgi:hypothetical protein